jgi:hypothetical protein
MHSESKIVEIEFAKVLPRDGKWIEIVLFEISAKFAAALFLFAPNETDDEENSRRDDRSDHVDAELALQSFNHRTNFL